MDREKITASQLFCLIVLFELGSSIVVGLGLEAKQDVWIALLLSMCAGILLYLLYGYLFKSYPGLPLTDYIPKIVGKYIGIPLSLAYIAYFLYISGRVLRDFGDLLTTSTLTETPLLAVNAMMMALVVYGAYHGIEVIGRTSEPVFFVMILLLFFGVVFIVMSGKFEFKNLLPVLENGWGPVLRTISPQTYSFPFGEMIVFTMLLPALNKPALWKKTGLYGIIIGGLILMAAISTDIAVLGVGGTARSQFPLLETFSKVNIGDFIQRLDILVISTLILGMFMKIMLFFFAGVIGFTQLLHVKKKRHQVYVILILGLATLAASILMAGSFTEHIQIGIKWVPLYLHLPLQTVIPLLLGALTLVRKLWKKP